MSTTRVGIIGTGWGMMHLGAFRDAGADVVALCGAHADKTRDIAAREGVPLSTTDVAVLVDAVDLVVVASPDAMHAAHVTAALRAGRAVLCEKPLTRTLDEALTIPTDTPSFAAINFPYRELPTFRALHDALQRLPAGTHVSATVRNGFVRGHLGSSGDFGGVSHVLDAALWLARGRVSSVGATLAGSTVLLQLGLARDATIAIAQVATNEPGIWGEWVLTGDGWDARLAAGYRPALGGWELGEVTLWERGTSRVLHPRVAPVEGHLEPWAAAHRGVARAVLARERERLASLEHGVHLQAIFDAARRSHDLGRRIEL